MPLAPTGENTTANTKQATLTANFGIWGITENLFLPQEKYISANPPISSTFYKSYYEKYLGASWAVERKKKS